MHDFLIECHGNYMEMKRNLIMCLIDILRNSSPNLLGFGCPGGCFLRVWVSKKTSRRPAG